MPITLAVLEGEQAPRRSVRPGQAVLFAEVDLVAVKVEQLGEDRPRRPTGAQVWTTSLAMVSPLVEQHRFVAADEPRCLEVRRVVDLGDDVVVEVAGAGLAWSARGSS